MTTDILTDYKNIHTTIFNTFTDTDSIDTYLDTYLDENNGTIISNLSLIKLDLENLNLDFLNRDIDAEDIDDDDLTNFELKKKLINRKKNMLTLIQMFLTIIILVLIISIVLNMKNNMSDISINKEYFIDNISYITLLFYFIYIIHYNIDYLKDKTDIEKDTLNNIGKTDLEKINIYLKELKNSIKYIMCDSDDEKKKTKFLEKKGGISQNIINFKKKYDELSNVNINNKLIKENKIKDINVIFINFKEILYKQNNKFDNLVINNDGQVTCLMNLILPFNSSMDTINCNLNNGGGLQGIIDTNTVNEFNNGLSEIGPNQVNDLTDKLTKTVIDISNKFELDKILLFKSVLNIFKMRILQYNIKKHEFVVYIYSYFESLELGDNDITISRYDIINNYKTIINIIYNEYDDYKKIEDTNKEVSTYIINKNKFNEIMNFHTDTNLTDMKTKLIDTIAKIKEYKKTHGSEIYNDIKIEQRFNKSLEGLCYVILIISVLQIIKIGFNKNFSESGYIESSLDITMYSCIALLFNGIILSYWYKKSINSEYNEMLLKNNENIFIKKLELLANELDNVIIIKKSHNEPSTFLTNLLKKHNISTATNDTDDMIYSKQNSGSNYTIIEERDVHNIIYNDFYIELSNVLKVYECCTFLNRKTKIPVFPWTDFSINLIFYIIIFAIIFNIFFLNDELNPISLITELKMKLFVDKLSKSEIKKSINQSGGEYKTEILKQSNLIRLLIIYLTLLYTYNIYYSTFQYYENLFL